MTSKHLLESVCTSHQDLFHSSRVPFLVLCGPRWIFALQIASLFLIVFLAVRV